MERNKKMGLYYERQLEAKIGRQKEEITRLLAETQKLKGMNSTICEEAIEQARHEGQQEAWGLAIKCMLMNNIDREVIFGSGHNAMYGVLTYHTYPEAAAKVAEWKKAKEEICVGDVVEFTNGTKAVVIKVYEDGEVALLFSDGGYGTYRPHKNWHKTDRHIDISEWLAQIGGDCNG